MEAIFRVALVLLRTHEEALLACDSFEQIMDYMKTSMPNVQLSQQGSIIAQVFSESEHYVSDFLVLLCFIF